MTKKIFQKSNVGPKKNSLQIKRLKFMTKVGKHKKDKRRRLHRYSAILLPGVLEFLYMYIQVSKPQLSCKKNSLKILIMCVFLELSSSFGDPLQRPALVVDDGRFR